MKDIDAMIQAGLVYDNQNPETLEEITVAQVIEEADRPCCNRTCWLNLVRNFYMSWVLMLICFFVYIGLYLEDGTMITGCTLQTRQARWAPSIILHKQVWRLVTALFIHQNPLHLFVNLSGMSYVCFMLEYKLGHVVMPVLFLVIGILSGMTSTLINPYLLACGASGPVLAFIGINFLIIMFEDQSHMQNPIMHRVAMGSFHVVGLIITFVADMIGTSHTDLAFHWFSLLAAVFAWMILFPLQYIKYAPWVARIYYRKTYAVMGVMFVIVWVLTLAVISTNMQADIVDFTVCDIHNLIMPSDL